MNKFQNLLLITIMIIFTPWGLEVRSQENQSLNVKEEVSEKKFITTSNPEIPTEELKLMVMPLTKTELQKESQGWLLLLKSKVQEISNAEIAVKRQSQQIKETEESVKAINKAEKTISKIEKSDEKIESTEKVDEALEKVEEEIKDVNEEQKNTKTDVEINKAIEEAKKDTELPEEKNNQLNPTAKDSNREKKIDQVQENINKVEVKDGITQKENQQVTQDLNKIEAQLKKVEEEKTEIKQQLVENVTELQIERTALIERFNIVLDELELKGGEIADYQKYIQAVSGLELDITDTDSLGIRIFTWLQSEEGGLLWVLSTLRFVGIILSCLFLGWLLNKLYEITHNKYLATQLDSQIEPILRTVIHLLIWSLVGIVTLSSVGINVSAIITSLGIGGLAFALAAQDTVANLFGGVTLLVQRKIKVGERIEVDGIKAKVVEIGLRTTIIRELDYDYDILVPNSKFTNNIVSNIDSRPHYSNYVVLHLHHSLSSEKIELALELIKAIASKNDYIKGARPSLDKINDYSFDLKFVYWIKKWLPEEKDIFPNDLWKMYTVKSQMNLAIMREFENNDIKLALPLRLSQKPSEIQTDGKGIFNVVSQDTIEPLK